MCSHWPTLAGRPGWPGRILRCHSEAHMKIASNLTLDDMDIAAEVRVHDATWDTSAQVLGRGTECGQRTPEANINQIGTMGTKILRSSRARRKVRIRKVIRLVPELVRAAPDDKLSLFINILGAGGP